MREREGEQDSYWTDDVALGEVALPREAAMVRLRLHQSEERIRDHEELLPLVHKTGPRFYVHARPYVLEPAITLTVGLFPTPTDAGAVGEVVASDWEGMRQREIGQAQGWYYPLDCLLMLWECYVFDQWRQDDPVRDPALHALWQGFEQALLNRFPEAERIATPSWEDIYERPAWQTFLGLQGFEPGPLGVFIKGRGPRPPAEAQRSRQ
jgi:hypothetical protein